MYITHNKMFCLFGSLCDHIEEFDPIYHDCNISSYSVPKDGKTNKVWRGIVGDDSNLEVTEFFFYCKSQTLDMVITDEKDSKKMLIRCDLSKEDLEYMIDFDEGTRQRSVSVKDLRRKIPSDSRSVDEIGRFTFSMDGYDDIFCNLCGSKITASSAGLDVLRSCGYQTYRDGKYLDLHLCDECTELMYDKLEYACSISPFKEDIDFGV